MKWPEEPSHPGGGALFVCKPPADSDSDHDDDGGALFVRKQPTSTTSLSPAAGLTIDWPTIVQALKKCKYEHHCLHSLRAMLNCYNTTARFHGDRKCCVFGCSSPDDIRHYNDCPIMWSMIHNRLNISTNSSTNYVRIHINRLEHGDLFLYSRFALSFASQLFHIVKAESRSGIQIDQTADAIMRRYFAPSNSLPN